MRALIVCILLVSLGGLTGCPKDMHMRTFSSFTRNKLEVVVRTMQSTRDAQQTAVDQLVSTLAAIKARGWTGANPEQAYDMARRMASTCESRVHTGLGRVALLNSMADDYFAQWSREIDDYEDADLRQAARRERNSIRDAYKDVYRAFEEAQDSTRPVLEAIQDQVLFLKHHRNHPAVPPRPEPTIDLATIPEVMITKVNLARIKAEEFIDAAQVRH